MDESYEQEYFKIEKEYWWFKARRHLIKNIKISKNSKILEVGCGTGLNLELFNTTEKYGIDISKNAIEQAKKKGLKAKVQDITKAKLPENSYDLILALDLIEHLKQDKATLEKLSKALKPKGKIIITVPAFQFLWSKHDELNHHIKRYNKKDFKRIIPKTLKTKRLTYWNFTLFPLVFLLNKVNKKSSNLKPLPKPINTIFYTLLKLENYLVKKKICFPVGTSLFFIGEKHT
jgi:2-polyprenyl-3-methyl-5-hydroxy-6-metoxy-1,4-benzoquinol methylase